MNSRETRRHDAFNNGAPRKFSLLVSGATAIRGLLTTVPSSGKFRVFRLVLGLGCRNFAKI
jgi:hypothetical protein